MTDFIMQKYIIIPEDTEPFTTNYFDAENLYIEGSTVINLHSAKYTTDGKEWKDLPEDNL